MKIHGLLLLDKPRGISSNQALQKARRLLEADKAGHGGTLDPMADGLLPVLFGEACKLAETALQGDKAYDAVLRLGQTTATDDSEGEILATAPVQFDQAQLEAVLARFRGEIVQVPPVYSALKVGGKALYRHAREGKPLQPAPRRVLIHQLQLLGRSEGEGTGEGTGEAPSLSLRVACSKGTYIRSLARDIGAALGCGAHLAALRRTQVGRFTIDQAVSLEQLAAMAPSERGQRLVALEALVAGWPSATLDEASARLFRQGQAVRVAQESMHAQAAPPEEPDVVASASKIAVHCGGRLIGLGRSTPTTGSTCLLSPARIIAS